MEAPKKPGAPAGNRNRSKGKHQRSFISLSGPANDKIVERLASQGIELSPTSIKEAVEEVIVNWDLFDFPDLSPEEVERQKEEKRAMGEIRADYRYFCYLQSLSLEDLRKEVEDGPFPVNSETGKQFQESDYEVDEHHRKMAARYLRKHRQAIVVLEERKVNAMIARDGAIII